MLDSSSFFRVDLESNGFTRIESCSAIDLKIKEKRIEDWMAQQPDLFFSDSESVMIISKEKSGMAQPDILAVDSQGNLIIVEIKRHWSDRHTVAQILDYSSSLSEKSVDYFNKLWQEFHEKTEGSLFNRFKDFVDNEDFNPDDFLKQKRMYIVASEADEALRRIVGWLSSNYDVPITFVPISFFKDGNNAFVRIEQMDVEPIQTTDKWSGCWFFNTNETYSPGSYVDMLKQSVIAACGYGNVKTKRKMDGPAIGERVFFYLNRRGIIACGEVLSTEAEQGSTVFKKDNRDFGDDEYHRKVKLIARIPPEKGITASDVGKWGFRLPVRCTIGKIYDSRIADRIAEELTNRMGKKA